MTPMTLPRIPRRDLVFSLIIGAAVGLLIQPILANNASAHDLAYVTPIVRVGLVVLFAVIAPLVLWIAKLLSVAIHGLHNLYQFAQFAAVGTLNSFIYGGILNIETALYGSTAVSNLRFAVFIAISFLFSTTNSFFWNKYWTFNAGEKTNAGEVGGFYGVALVGLVLSTAAATLVKSIGPLDSRLWENIFAPIAGIAAAFIWNFIGYKYWVFKKKV
jgi:putative flippase GtrA